MHSLTYKDLIDEKTAEWQSSLKKLEEQAGKSSSNTKTMLNTKIEQFKSAIDTAIIQLHDLDKQETVDNTMETKNQILKIFSSIDKDFKEYEEVTPFML
jgi:hypothetical protein